MSSKSIDPSLSKSETTLGNTLNLDTHTYTASLDQLDCLIVSGKDARSFLQGQVTCDMNAVSQHHSLPGAHCTNKGRVVFSFRAIELPPKETHEKSNEEKIALIIPTELLDIAHKALSKFIVFSKASLHISQDYKILGLFGKDASTIVNDIKDSPEISNALSIITILPNQMICLVDKNYLEKLSPFIANAVETSFSSWQLCNIRGGIADIYAGASELFLPQMLNFDENEGINYKKGCYIGQENTARIKLKNKLSKRLLAIQLISGKLTEGASIYANDIEIGKVLINDEYPFALIKYLDENFKKDSELKSENAVLRIKIPNWI